MDRPAQDLQKAEDGTAYWTLSFYISRAQIENSATAIPPDGDVFSHFSQSAGPPDIPLRFDARAEARRLTMAQPGEGATKDEQARYVVQQQTTRLRDAIDPLFNDIADRSRLGRVEDHLFAAGDPVDLWFVMPDRVRWSTEGQTYEVPIAKSGALPRFPVHVRRFWYLHGNGALSWHVSFAVCYRDNRFEDSLSAGQVPVALYLLSLIQKLAFPKELKLPEAVEDQRSDRMIGLMFATTADAGAKSMEFWDVLDDMFADNAPFVQQIYPDVGTLDFESLCPVHDINEVPGLQCHDTRSQIFIQDQEFFELIQPKDDNGDLIERRTRVLDTEFKHYPGLVTEHADPDPDDNVVVLGAPYWAAMHVDPSLDGKEVRTDARSRLLYLFLAGFNQNIIDWTNQEASEVLDSLDPIYPQSDEQLEEGFFIRYANPRTMISYVQRSRTLEVGNDYIGTCPYAFLIHVLAMHNERLTRDQEKLAFAVVEKVNALIKEAHDKEDSHSSAAGRLVQQTEKWINWYRMAAFELFDRHRYTNPFRYDTERDVFAELEKLRGTSRLVHAIDKAFAALEESARDLDRIRLAKQADEDGRQNLILTIVFGIVGLAGLAQVVLQIDDLRRDARLPMSWAAVIGDLAITGLIGILLYAAVRIWFAIRR